MRAMNKPELQKPIINFKRAALVGALSLTAVIAPGVASADVVSKKHGKVLPMTRLDKQTEERMSHGKGVTFLRGDLVIYKSLKDSHPLVTLIQNPLLVNKHNHDWQRDFKDVEASGEYAVGSMAHTGDKPKVKLINYDNNRMFFVNEPGSGPNIQYAFFQSDKMGGVNLNNPLDSFDSLPITDPDGNPEPIGKTYPSKS
jgi:hypothetical protein